MHEHQAEDTTEFHHADAEPGISPPTGTGGGDHAAPGHPADTGREDHAPGTPQPAPPVAPRSARQGGAELPPLPAYLAPLVECGAFEDAELRGVGHRTARLKIEGDAGTTELALAHLAPDALATIRRKVGAGHVTGTITPAQGAPLSFALYIEPAPGEEPEELDPRDARIAALERRLAEPRAKTELEILGEQIAIDALSKALNPPDPIEQLERMIGQVAQMATLPAKIKGQFGALAELLAPAVQAHVENPEEAKGLIGVALEKGVEWAMQPGNIMRALQMLRGGFGAEGVEFPAEAEVS